MRRRIILNEGSLVSIGAARSEAENLLARLAIILLWAQASDQRLRLTPCQDCRWVTNDGSKNRTARWCSMSPAAAATTPGPTADEHEKSRAITISTDPRRHP